MPVSIHVLMSPGCGHGQKALGLVRDVVAVLAPDARIEATEVSSIEEAELLGFSGSPTVLVNGVDVDPGPAGGVGLG